MTGNLTNSLSATELTKDHSPAGGIVVTLWGKPWVNAELPMSRAIGDVVKYQKRLSFVCTMPANWVDWVWVSKVGTCVFDGLEQGYEDAALKTQRRLA
ncbi:hypothetical protein CFP56_018355, partial [Quercus suber]